MREDQANLASMNGYMAAVLMHEICHGLGPAFARTSAGQTDIRAAIGPTYAGLEEAKADMVWPVRTGLADGQRRDAQE